MTPTRISAVVVAERFAWVWTKMAGYRNRMVHFYAEVSRQELYEICSMRAGDITAALSAVRAWLAAHPDRVDPSL